MKIPSHLSFEEAFSELEGILQKMNEGEVPLEKLLGLFEKGNTLLGYCQGKLEEAEKKIEILLKSKEGSLELDAEKKPQKVDFSPERSSQFSGEDRGL